MRTAFTIPCEGECSAEEHKATLHHFDSEVWIYRLEAFSVNYGCTICGTVRRYGLHEVREHTKGDRN